MRKLGAGTGSIQFGAGRKKIPGRVEGRTGGWGNSVSDHVRLVLLTNGLARTFPTRPPHSHSAMLQQAYRYGTKLIATLKRYRGSLCIDRAELGQTVFVAGSGRSGTTWLQELINYDGTYRVLFEPFHAKKVDVVSHWKYRQYIQPDNIRTPFIEPARIILSGRIRDPWIDKFNRAFFPRKRIVKEIRTQLCLKWLSQQFPEISLVYLLRHPCAVARSRLKLGWEACLDTFLSQPALRRDLLQRFVKPIQAARSAFERQIYMWCIENYVPLVQLDEGDAFVVFYENLCQSPTQQMQRVFTFIDRRLTEDALHAHETPSSLTREHSASPADENRIQAWREDVSEAQVQRAVEILERFGLDRLYDAALTPHLSGDEVLSQFAK